MLEFSNILLYECDFRFSARKKERKQTYLKMMQQKHPEKIQRYKKKVRRRMSYKFQAPHSFQEQRVESAQR